MYVEMPIDIMTVSIWHEHIESDNEPTWSRSQKYISELILKLIPYYNIKAVTADIK